MTASQYAKQLQGKSRKQNKKSSMFSNPMVSRFTIEANKKTVNVLDVTLDLTSGSYNPYMKPNNKLLCVHQQSNHPRALKKSIPLVDKCFLPNHPLYKIFNRHTLKLSYSCMPNMKTIISAHNKKILSQDTATLAPTQQERACNSGKKPECPLEEKCLQANVVYQASVTTETTNESYVGLATNFTDRHRNHMT